jgi:hypothetical protein
VLDHLRLLSLLAAYGDSFLLILPKPS